MALTPEDGLLVYTDGSYTNKGPGGWAWVAVDGSGGQLSASGFVPPPTTNNRMEMQAQIEGLLALSFKYGPCEIEIVSDSKYIVEGATDPSRARIKNKDLWAELEEAVAHHDHVQWRHIRGHVGIKWNELADELAVRSRKEGRWQ